MAFQYNTIPEALEALRAGKLIMCTDDPERENEGDLICAAQFATTENINTGFLSFYQRQSPHLLADLACMANIVSLASSDAAEDRDFFNSRLQEELDF